MLLHATIHGLTEQTNNDGETLKYCEMLTTHPLQTARFNVTKFNAQQFQKLESLIGQDVIIGLEQRKTSNGANYWQMTKFPEPLPATVQPKQPQPEQAKQPASMFTGKTATA